MERHKRRWSVIYEGDVGSAWEWYQINLHTSCDVPAPLNQLKTTVVDAAQSFFAPAVVVIYINYLLFCLKYSSTCTKRFTTKVCIHSNGPGHRLFSISSKVLNYILSSVLFMYIYFLHTYLSTTLPWQYSDHRMPSQFPSIY